MVTEKEIFFPLEILIVSDTKKPLDPAFSFSAPYPPPPIYIIINVEKSN